MAEKRDFEPRFERRDSARTACELLRCPLGRVADLSASGMQVRGEGRAVFENGEVLDVALSGVPHAVQVRAEVVWVEPTRDGGFAAGFRFRELDGETVAELQKLAQTERQIGAVTQDGLVRFPDVQN